MPATRLESALWDAYVSQTRQRNRTVTRKRLSALAGIQSALAVQAAAART